jgi:hypothetical protein
MLFNFKRKKKAVEGHFFEKVKHDVFTMILISNCRYDINTSFMYEHKKVNHNTLNVIQF